MAKEIIIDMNPQDNHESGKDNIIEYLRGNTTNVQLIKLLNLPDTAKPDAFKHEDLVYCVITKACQGKLAWSRIIDDLDIDNVRVCTECGQPMVAGVYGDGRYYCSDECLDKGLGIENYLELADPDDDNSEYYYTEWN